MSILQDLRDLSLSGLQRLLAGMGEKPFRAQQLRAWLYRRGARRLQDMSDLSQGLRARLSQAASLRWLEPVQILKSGDGTQKLLYRLDDGRYIESALIAEEDHHTLCVSTQAGCRMGCKFCRTASLGLERNLLPGEISGQILSARSLLADAKRPLTNLVFMGMGEPLDNLDNLLIALEHVLASDGLGFSQRRVTVSTVGLLDKLQIFAQSTTASLAVSLNAAQDDLRSQLMPVNRRFGLDDLRALLMVYPLKPTRRITLEYVLLKGVNDSLEHARQLAMWCRGLRCKINLIPFNPHPGSSWQPPEQSQILSFQENLISYNLTAMLRRSRGQDIGAACGQLGGRDSN
jgi:23S rRNA (adenine2503-C2)-methyltransferase